MIRRVGSGGGAGVGLSVRLHLSNFRYSSQDSSHTGGSGQPERWNLGPNPKALAAAPVIYYCVQRACLRSMQSFLSS